MTPEEYDRQFEALENLVEAIDDTGPCDCDHCPRRKFCITVSFACEYYSYWTEGREPKGRTMDELSREPNRMWYDRVFPNQDHSLPISVGAHA